MNISVPCLDINKMSPRDAYIDGLVQERHNSSVSAMESLVQERRNSSASAMELLVQEWRNSSASAMELCLSYIKPSTCISDICHYLFQDWR